MIHAQEKTSAASAATYTISKSKLIEAKILEDIIPDLPKNYSFIKYEIALKTGGVLSVMNGTGNELKVQARSALRKATVNTKMYVDIMTHENKKPHEHAYSLYIIE